MAGLENGELKSPAEIYYKRIETVFNSMSEDLKSPDQRKASLRKGGELRLSRSDVGGKKGFTVSAEKADGSPFGSFYVSQEQGVEYVSMPPVNLRDHIGEDMGVVIFPPSKTPIPRGNRLRVSSEFVFWVEDSVDKGKLDPFPYMPYFKNQTSSPPGQ